MELKKKLKMEDVIEEKPKPQPRGSVGCYVFDDHEYFDDPYLGLTSEDINPNEGDK